ncbi:MAG: SpoIIE family protein phosphatase [Sphingobacteriaceae bacterium]|nr:SpoIIE family protein phosphatase [Sphingobacteriaceae bacterium]
MVADSLNMVLERRSNELRVKEEKNKRLFLYGGLAILLFVVIFVFNRLQVTKKQKEVIAKQKLEVESQNELIVKQKELVEEKQKEIVDSINYAKRIQQAVLTGNEVWQNIAKDHFILFQPKDIVSGDFYWATNVNSNLSIFALADCTGHGVPGGFMSMLGNSFLNEIIVEKKIHQPGEILNQLRDKIIKALAQEGQSNQKDGMDICLCTYDKKKGTLDFAGANNPLWIVNSNEITEYKGDKMPIGVYVNELKPFSNTTINIKDGDCLYLITDGFADQFGGDKGKKFKYKPLMELLQKNQQRSMNEQGAIFLSVINDWKKGYEQVDDISLIGIRV